MNASTIRLQTFVRHLKGFAIVGFWLLLSLPFASAAPPTVVYDGFNYGTTSAISGQNGGSGWGAAWYKYYGSGTTLGTDSSGFTYSGLSTVGGRTVFGGGTGNEVGQAERAVTRLSSGMVYIQFLANVESGSSGGGTPQIRLRDGASTVIAFGGNGSPFAGVWSILSPSLGAKSDGTSSTSAALNTLNLVVIRIDYSGNATKMWVNPNLSTFDYYNPPAANATYAGLAPAFDSVGLYTRNPGSYDEFRIMQVSGNPPTDIALSATSINENNAASATIGTLSTTDADGGSFTYSLVTGTGDTDNGSFTISGSSLLLTPSANYEAKSSYAVRIQTTDSTSNTYSEAFTITINNLPETPTDITLTSTSVAENVAGNTTVGTLGTADSDTGDTFTYALVTGTGDTDNGAFNLSGTALRINSSPDFETKSSYAIRVSTTDSTSRTFEKQFTINITNVNEMPSISDVADQTINEDGNTGALAITISDVETAAGSLTMSGSSSNTTLIPNGNIVFGGSGANRTVTVTPAANLSGTSTITVTVSDGGLTASDTFTVTVNAANDVPTISNITDRTIEATLNTGAVAFTIGDVETAAASLVVSGTSSDTGVIPNGNIVFGGSGASRTVTVTAPAGVTGTSTISVEISDGVDSVTDTFVVTVIPFNELPTISDITNQTTDEDTATSAIAFTIGDAETAAASLNVTGASSNTTLIPNGNIVFGGSGASRTVTVTPAANLSGTATITVTVSDGVKTGSDTFTVTVNAVNDAPTIGDVANQTVNEDVATSALAFTVGDAETAAASLTMSGSSSDTAVVPNGNIVFGGSGASRTVTVTPAANLSGTSTITVTVSDGVNSTSDTFTLTVNAVNDAPTISDVTNQTVNEDVATSALAITVGDVETAAASLTMSGGSSNTTLVPVSNIVFGGSGANRTVTVTPAANANGTATITLTVNDGTTTTNDTFVLTVNAVNDTPTISDVADQTINEDNPTNALAITVGDVETAAASLTMSAASTNTTLVPVSNIVFGGSGASRTVVITPVANGNGTATITLNVSDGSLTGSDTVLMTVTAVNDAPAFTGLTYQLAYESTNPVRSGSNITYVTNNSAALAAATFNRVRYRMQVDVSSVTRYADVSFDSWAGLTVANLKVPDGSNPVAYQRNVTNMAVDSNYAGVVNASGQTGRIEIWPSNYSTGVNGLSPAGNGGTYDYDDNGWGTSVGHGSFQVHNLSSTPIQTVLAYNSHSSSPPEIGFGNFTGTHPDWTFAGGQGLGMTNWKLQIYIGNAGVPSTFTVTEDAASNLLMFGSPITDPDASSLTVTLAIADGAITGNAGTGVTVGGTATARTFTGTVADLNTYFTTAGKVTYLGVTNNVTARTLTITSDDGVAAPTVTTATVNFTPVNDTPSALALSNATLAENVAANTTVGTLSTTDIDTGDTFTYSLVSGTGSTDNASFNILGSALRITASPNYEVKSSYAVRVRTTDAGGLFTEDQFTVTITDTNDAPTALALSATAVAENVSANTTVGTLSSTDSDPGDTTFTYSLVSGTGSTDNASFNISGNALRITASPNYETKSSYAVRVRTTDPGSLFFEQQFTITITNVNEGPAISDISNVAVNEDAATGALAFTISDPDTAAVSLIVSGGSDNVTVVPDTNIVFGGSGASRTVTVTPTANAAGSAVITVTVSDGSLTASDTFTLTVNSANDAPSFAIPTPAAGATWTARDSVRNWYAMASSSDGTKLVAGASGGLLYTSTDSGATWTPRNGPTVRNYYAVASSADGTKLVAAVTAGQLWTSTDSGVTWTARDSNRNWSSVASSADGTKLVAGVESGSIYTSTDSGVTWTARMSGNISAVASSTDGVKLVATVGYGKIYTSIDSGATWTARDSDRLWRCVASSIDGTKLVAAEMYGKIYTSTDSGVTWIARDSDRQWISVASSADGTRMVATAKNVNIYTSTDSGVTWASRSVTRSWWSVASSADGSKLVSGVENGQIYTSTGSGTYTHTVAEDSGAQTVSSFATSISAGPANESAQVVSFTVTNTNNPLFSVQPAIAANGTLTFTPAANANGTATVSVTAVDDGGTANSGVNTSAEQTFTIAVSAGNDAPAVAATNPSVTVNEGSLASNTGTYSDIDTSDTVTITASVGSISYAPASTLYADTTTGGRWRTSSVAKPLDVDGNNVYGSDGYGMWGLGGTAAIVNPSYATITTAGSFFGGNGSYINIDNPANPAGAQVVTGVTYGSPGGTNPTTFATVTFSQARTVRMGILVDNADIAAISPTTLRLRQTVGGTRDTGHLTAGTVTTRNRSVDFYFFDIQAQAGDVYEVSGNNDAGHSSNGIGGVFFDTGSAAASTGTWNWSYTPTDGPANSATVTITATDNGSPVQAATTTFALNVTNVAPTATFAATSATANENTVSPPSVSFTSPVDVSAPDTSGAFKYSYDFDNDGTWDQGDGTYAGSITSASQAIPASYFAAPAPATLVVKGRILDKDGGSTAYTTSITINRTASNIALSPGSVAENSASNTSVGTLSATDADVGDTHTFSLTTGTGDTDNASFTIVGTTLRLTPSADFETKSSYAVRVRATDGGGISFDKALTVAITNVNETPTNMALSSTTVTESVAANTVVGAISTTDVDVADTFTYTLVSGAGSTDNSAFNISGSSLRLTSGPVLASQSTYGVRLRSTDAGGLYFEKAFTITVIAPEISVEQSAVAIASGGSKGFATTATGSHTSLIFTVKNTGSADLTDLAVSFTGTHATDFSVTSAPAASIAGPSGQTDFTVRFAPIGPGARTAVLRLANSDYDENPYTINLTGSGGTTASALAFDGNDDAVQIPAHADFNSATFTIEGWVKPNSSTPQWSRLWGTENNQGDLIVKTGAKNCFSFAPVIDGAFVYVTAPDAWVANQWYHVAGVLDEHMIRLFVNGVQVAATPYTGTWAGDAGVRYLGKSTSPSKFKGIIDDVRFWNYARNCDQISQARTGELTGSETGLVAYYRLNDGLAGGDNASVTAVTDGSGHGHHGTPQNFALTYGNITSNWVTPGAVVNGNLAPTPQFPEIVVKGNGVALLTGDTTPSETDHTDFGATETSVTRTFTIENTGNIDLTVASIDITGSTDFTVGGFTPGVIVPSGNSTTFTIAIPSTTDEIRQATVTINWDPLESTCRHASLSIL